MPFLRRRKSAVDHKLAIRREWPLRWRVVAVLCLTIIGVGLAALIYDAGLRVAGFRQSESGRRTDELEQRVDALIKELATTSELADTSAARLQVEITAQARLASVVKSLEEENARLRSELAVFENLAGSNQAVQTLAISRFELQPGEGSGNYRFKLLATKSGRNADRLFNGKLVLDVSVEQTGKSHVIVMPTEANAAFKQLEFRYFKRIEGQFDIPAGSVLKQAEAKLVEDGQIKASQVARVDGNGGN